MHLVLSKNREMVDEVAHWLEAMELPTAWAVPIVQDCERGENLKLIKALKDQMLVSATNARAEHRSVDGMGQVGMEMASSLRTEIERRYKDRHVLEDRKFLKKIEQEYGFRFTPNYQRKAQITHPGLKGFRKWHGRAETASS